MTPWQAHVERWRDCDRCPLCIGRKNVVLARGRIPCDVLFVGEAPGDSEDVLGEPFVGPAGKLLDEIIREAYPIDRLGIEIHSTFAFTNLVACFPREAKQTENHAPPDAAIKACASRLVELVAIAKPRLIVTVGTLADRWAPKGLTKWTGRWVSIQRPAAILRAPTAQKNLMVRRAVVTLRRVLEGLE